MIFQSPTLGKLSLPEIIGRIREYAEDGPAFQHKVIIGTDSAPARSGRAEFVTAIVVHRVGNGGIYFWNRQVAGSVQTLRDRMYREAVISLEVAQKLVNHDLIIPGLTSADLLEIHIDIGENGPTRQMIREIVGMVTGSGFAVRTKPDSFAASKVADRYT